MDGLNQHAPFEVGLRDSWGVAAGKNVSIIVPLLLEAVIF